MIIDFSSLGCGDGRQTDLCSECRYSVKIQRHDRVPQIMWLSGSQITEQYGSQDVKITIRGIKRCAGHAARGREKVKGKPAFLEAALKSNIDILPEVDLYRKDILKK